MSGEVGSAKGRCVADRPSHQQADVGGDDPTMIDLIEFSLL
jgi:hypothetical protein